MLTKVAAIEIDERQVSSQQQWVERHLDEAVTAPLEPCIAALVRVQDQDLENPETGGAQ